MVGDKAQDIEAARSAGVALGIHVLTGHGNAHEAHSRVLATQHYAVRVAADAPEAASLLAKHGVTLKAAARGGKANRRK